MIQPFAEPEEDIMYLLESLEEVLSDGARVPFTRRTLIDDEKCLEIIDQIKLSLPKEIRQARQVNAQRDALMDEARKRAEQIVKDAEMEARERMREHHIAREAEAHRQEILSHVERQADQLRRDADDYAYRALLDLDHRLEGLSAVVRGGLRALETDTARPSAELPGPESHTSAQQS